MPTQQAQNPQDPGSLLLSPAVNAYFGEEKTAKHETNQSKTRAAPPKAPEDRKSPGIPGDEDQRGELRLNLVWLEEESHS